MRRASQRGRNDSAREPEVTATRSVLTLDPPGKSHHTVAALPHLHLRFQPHLCRPPARCPPLPGYTAHPAGWTIATTAASCAHCRCSSCARRETAPSTSLCLHPALFCQSKGLSMPVCCAFADGVHRQQSGASTGCARAAGQRQNQQAIRDASIQRIHPPDHLSRAC